jgi:phytoene dehydrogenase-like protein
MREIRAAMTTNCDAILIGSGIGALPVAFGLVRHKHWRCLILEQNFNLGGMTQEFVRERCCHFDVGAHYVGEMNPTRR